MPFYSLRQLGYFPVSAEPAQGDTHINIVGDVEYNSRTDEAKVGGGFTINVDL
jgi:hypothetical protein